MRCNLSPEQLIELFTDPGTWLPFMDDAFDGVVCGHASIDGKPVCMYIQDLEFKFGTIGETHGRKIAHTIETAIRLKCPLVGIIRTGGARIQEGAMSLAASAEIAYSMVKASGYVPIIAIVDGPAAGGGAYMAALSDVTIMSGAESYLFLTGPKIIERVLNTKITEGELGGPEVHSSTTGLIQHRCEHIVSARDNLEKLIQYLPAWTGENRFYGPQGMERADPGMSDLLPDSSGAGYDMMAIVDRIADEGSVFEQSPEFAGNAITAFIRLAERPVGVIANQPMVMGGILDVASTRKISRFVQICDAFNIPLLFLVDCPGFLPGKDEEWNNSIAHGGYMAHHIAASTVPRVSMIIRKAIGGAYATLNCKALGSDLDIAWTSAQISVLGSDAALDLLLQRRSGDKEVLKREYEDEYLNPYKAAESGLIDRVIDPSESRLELIKAFNRLETKSRGKAIPRKRRIFPMV